MKKYSVDYHKNGRYEIPPNKQPHPKNHKKPTNESHLGEAEIMTILEKRSGRVMEAREPTMAETE